MRNAIFALLTWILVFSAASVRARADLFLGINGHPFTAYPGVTIEQQLDYLVDLGLKSYRVNIADANAAGRLAKLIAAAKPRGIEILPVLTPGFDLDKETPTDLYRKAFELAEALVSRFKDDIRVWELGNELENYAIIRACERQDDGVQYNCTWGPAGGVGELDYFGPRWKKVSAVLKGLSDGTVSVDPTIRKAMGTAGWGHVGAFARMQKDGIRWDISVWHMYGQDPEAAFKQISGYKRPIWVTEFNQPLGSKESEQKQAEGLASWITRLRELSGTYKVEAAHLYELMDESYWAPNFEAVMGLVQLDSDGKGSWKPGRPKIAYFTVRDMVRGNGAAPLTVAQQAVSSRLAKPIPEQRNCDLEAFKSTSEVSPRQRVAYAYCLVLGRAVDGFGLQSYAAALDKGATIPQLLLELAISEEFRQKYSVSKLSNLEFVNLLYKLLLDREPDASGLKSYVAGLDSEVLTRVQFASALFSSGEFRTRHELLFTGG